jgi:hypothetical protein
MVTRSFLKQNVPPPVKSMLRQFRQAISPPPLDERVLFDYQVEAERNDRPRLTMVIQFLAKGSDFGGAATGIDIFSRLAVALDAAGPVDIRIIITDASSVTDPTIIPKWAAKAGLTVKPEQIQLVSGAQDTITVRPREVFFTQIWWNMLNFGRVRMEQAKLFGCDPLPIIRLAQDYEPGWLEFSAAHMLARSAYDLSKPLWVIVNSGSLANYIDLMGHRFENRHVFEPVIVEALRPYLDRVATSERRKRILVYGRPGVARNCFTALVRGLQKWARDYPEFADWEVVSAGEPHDPVPLGDGRKLTSIGKLSLEEYAEMLLGSSVGVSLMASPHPSYPPLEMAHFGLRTITNDYLCKDLSTFHPNIVSIPSVGETYLAPAIAAACDQAASSSVGHVNEDYVRSDKYPFLPQLAMELGQVLRAEATVRA